ncbi:MAG: hypothetical protein JWR80_687 [Bradyrhizobium sp.]|nr:hypothetical protein [Bradyrhizobium sp.]
MDEDAIALAWQLCTRAGMIMEDISAEAILVGRLDAGQLDAVVERLRCSLGHARTLADAAAAMLESFTDQ